MTAPTATCTVGCTTGTQSGSVIHPVYLPFTYDCLAEHFAPVGAGGPTCQHGHYYRKGAQAAALHEGQHAGGLAHTAACAALDHQVEKDERFWITAALLHAFHSHDRLGALAAVLSDALGGVPPIEGGFPNWRAALGPVDDLRLFFEANLPSPPTYKHHLGANLAEHVLLPKDRAVAEAKGRAYEDSASSLGPALEGRTWVDAILVSKATGTAVVFEAKVLSDASGHTTYDATRNQLARTIDVLLDRNEGLSAHLAARLPARTCFVLVTPRMFQKQRSTRLYGHLMTEYSSGTELLSEHLPHRGADQLASVPQRLGWTSWERIAELVPGACGWLDDRDAPGGPVA
jgi:hypothetical protein